MFYLCVLGYNFGKLLSILKSVKSSILSNDNVSCKNENA